MNMASPVILNVINESGDVTNCCAVDLRPIEIDDAEAIELAGRLKALADPTRIQMLNLLAGCADPICVCEITPRFAISQPTISHHLKILRDAGFIMAERRGTFMYYQLNRAELAGLPEAVRQIFQISVRL
jgi:ArsR family transcriptional regulator